MTASNPITEDAVAAPMCDDGELTYIVPLHPTDLMLRCAKNALRNFINKTPESERAARWGDPVPGKGYQVGDDAKHRVRYQAMVLAAPAPSTSLKDKLADRERKISALLAQRDSDKATIEEMRKALEPLIAGHEKIAPYASNDTRASIWLKPGPGRAVTVGHVREAARVLAKIGAA